MTAPILVPEIPSAEMWGGLARQIVLWARSGATGAALYRYAGVPVPDWLKTEISDVEHVPPKGDVVAAIYRAMLDARPEALKRLREAELAVMKLAAKAIMDDRIDRAGTVWFRTRDRAVSLADAIIALAAARKEAGYARED